MIAGYQITETLCTSTGSHVYRAHRQDDRTTVLLKVLELGNKTGAKPVQFRHEFEILRRLAAHGIAKPLELIEQRSQHAIVMRDFAGDSLESILQRQRLNLLTCLHIASELAGMLDVLHAAHLVHHDIQPINILVSPDMQTICLIDSSCAASTLQEMPDSSACMPDTADLAYISPEQTGRMNRPVDYRTDFYSLGITLYRMLAGRLPFEAHGRLEWAYCHASRFPKAVNEIVRTIPDAVSNIVTKLLQKDAELRYQTARGLKFDLDECIAKLKTTGAVDPFLLGSTDGSHAFQLSTTLYGRDEEIAPMAESWRRMVQTNLSELVLVTGPAGSGKSALVLDLFQPIARQNGYFGYGTFRKDPSATRYAAIAAAFGQLVQQIGSDATSRVDAWRQQVLAALGSDVRLVAELIPELLIFLGTEQDSPPMPKIDPDQRLADAVRRFAEALLSQEWPTALFLDDLQHADPASLELINEMLVSATCRNVVMIGALQDKGAVQGDKLLQTVASIGDAVHVVEVAVGNLPVDLLVCLVADSLQCEPAIAKPLAAFIQQETNGNPSAAKKFLHELHADGLIKFEPVCRCWCWNMVDMNAARISSAASELIEHRFDRLYPALRHLLHYAACLGDRFTLATLAYVARESPSNVSEQLTEAIAQDLLTKIDGTAMADNVDASIAYQWVHERARQSIYALIGEEERSSLHVKIGRALCAELEERRSSNYIFEVVSHLNRGARLIMCAAERDQLARLNLAAACHARQSNSHGAAREYATAGLSMLRDDMWDSDYDLALRLHSELAEAEQLSERLVEAEIIIERALEYARTDLDRAELLTRRVAWATAQRDFASALDIGIEGLRLCHIMLPTDAAQWGDAAGVVIGRVRKALAEVQAEVRADTLLSRPPMTDREAIVASNLLAQMMTAAYACNMQMFALLTATLVELSLEKGNTGASAYGYAWFGVLGQKNEESIERAHRLGTVARQLADQLNSAAFTNKVRVTILLALDIWHHPLDTLIAALARELASGREYGDVQYVGLSSHMVLLMRLSRGEPLGALMDDIAVARRFANESSNQLAAVRLAHLEQSIASLRSTPERDPADCPLSQDLILNLVTDITTLRRHVVFGEFKAALPLAERMASMRMHSYMAAEAVFYPALVAAAVQVHQNAEERETSCLLLKASLEKLTAWANRCPENFLHMQRLLAAELVLIGGNHGQAILLYRQAILAAARYGFMHIEALAAERASHACHAVGLPLEATVYLYHARAAYAAWGADAKVRQIDTRFGLRTESDDIDVHDHSTIHRLGRIDFLNTLKALHALANESALEPLLDIFMRSAIDLGNAQTAYLLLGNREALSLFAEAHLEGGVTDVFVHDRGAVVPTAIPRKVIDHVLVNRQLVLVADATQPHPFSEDIFEALHHQKSVLCMPVFRKSSLVGLLYLENNIYTNAFIPDRLAVLEILVSQVAVSLDNMKLYQELRQEKSEQEKAVEKLHQDHGQLEQLVEQRTAELRQANQVLLQTNHKLGQTNNLLQQTEKRIQYMSRHDVLTGLPNRTLLNERIMHAIAQKGPEKNLMALLVVDLDNFKRVNDASGYMVGDQLLQTVARRLQKCVRRHDTVARLGGDEFVICVTGLTHRGQATEVANKILAALDSPVSIGPQDLHVDASIGISVYPDDGGDPNVLMQAADIAMYHAASKGSRNYQFFTAGMTMAVRQRMTIEGQLRQALPRNEFKLHYQPQVDIESGRIVSAEALIRWEQPLRGLVSPDEFIHLAEETGLILPIGEWVLREACAQLKRWHHMGYDTLSIAVNLSARQVLQPGFVSMVVRILHESDLDPAFLELEITESILMQPSTENIEALTSLDNLGIRLSVDDFGTGYSSLAYLKRFPIIHALKIDKSFVTGLDYRDSNSDSAIATTIITMAKNLGMQVIAEGVETLEQALFLAANGCSLAQGYYYSRPVDSTAFTTLLEPQLEMQT